MTDETGVSDGRFLDDVLLDVSPPPRLFLRTPREISGLGSLPPTLWPGSGQPGPHLWYFFPERAHREIWDAVYKPVLDRIKTG